MAGVTLELDPTSEDSANVPLVLVDNSTYFLLSEDWPSAEVDQLSVSSITTEGEVPVNARHHDATGTFSLRVVGANAAALQTALNYIDKKLAKIMREGGTLKRTTPSGATAVADLRRGAQAIQFTRRYTASNRADVTVTVTRAPYWRLTPVTLSSHSETTLPCLVFTETVIAGDVPALGRLIITEAQGASQAWVIWGIQSRYYDSAATAALFYEAEGRTPLGSAATAIGTGTPSGSGNNVVRSGALTTSMSAVLSTQTTAAGAQLSHVGDFQVYARCMSRSANTGTVSYALQWAAGDFLNPTTNATVTPSIPTNVWALVNLGQVSLRKAVQGTQVWEGRILAKSTVAGDTVDIDYLMLVPVTEGSGIVSAPVTTIAPSVIGGSDTFVTSGALNLLAADIGGAWATSGATTDFTEGSGVVTRATSGDAANAGRFAVLGTTSYTGGQVTQIDALLPTPSDGRVKQAGVLLRWTDASNHLRITVAAGPTTAITMKVIKRVTGTDTTLATVTSPHGFSTGTSCTIRGFVDAGGTVWAGCAPAGSPTGLTALAQDAVFATGGTLANGKAGFYDESTSADTRTYDNFLAYAFTGDAALFASRQLEVRYNSVIRQDSGGTLWRAPARYEGDYFLIPPSGREARSVRVIVKDCRNNPASGQDSSIDDITAQIVYTPRVLTLPE